MQILLTNGLKMDRIAFDFDNNKVIINNQHIELSSLSLINLILDLKCYYTNIATIKDIRLSYNSKTGDGLCYQIMQGKFELHSFNLTNHQSYFFTIDKQLAETIVSKYDRYCKDRENQRDQYE